MNHTIGPFPRLGASLPRGFITFPRSEGPSSNGIYVLANPFGGIKVRDDGQATSFDNIRAQTEGKWNVMRLSRTVSSIRAAGPSRLRSRSAPCWILGTQRGSGLTSRSPQHWETSSTNCRATGGSG